MKFSLIPIILLAGVLVVWSMVVAKPASYVGGDADTNKEVEVVAEEDYVLLGRAELSYAGGTPGRAKNIELGMARIDGTRVQHGDEFSFGIALGPVREEDGFTEQRVFLRNEVTTGLGGGLCQVSTILFQTALEAGLPITERHNHSYSVSYYREGLDATYAEGGPDLKFRNDTGHPIVIKGFTENEVAIFEIYGVDDGRQVEIGEVSINNIVPVLFNKYVAVPVLEDKHKECVNVPQIGYTSEVPYTVTLASGEKRESSFISIYKPLQRVCYVQAVPAL